MSDLCKVIMYSDGACVGNPGPGGYGVVLLYGNQRKEISGGFRLTTNNRMEMMAAIVGLTALRTKCSVIIHTDSRYLVNAIMQGWAERWRARGWKRNRKAKAINADLWAELLELCSRHEVEFVWVKGHAGVKENERCDEMAERTARQKNLPIDEGYENPNVQQITASLFSDENLRERASSRSS